MREVGGYVKLYRSFLDWEWYDDDACTKLFIHLLMIANWQETKWHGETLPAGSKIISQVELAARFGWSRQKMGRTLDKLKLTGEVICEPGTKWTRVTLVNWAKYQSEDQPTGHVPGTKRARTGHQAGTEEEGKNIRREEKSAVRSLEERLSDFKAACKAVVEKDPARLPEENRKEFLAYWVETTTDGTKMRFEAEKFFDHARRMDTWMKTAKKIDVTSNGFRSNGHGVKLYDGWSVEKIEAFVAQFKQQNGGRYPNSGDQNIPKAYKLYKEWI